MMQRWGDLQVFEKVRSGIRSVESYIRITPRKKIVFSAYFCSTSKELQDNKYVRLSYSKTENAIVFDFTNTKKFSLKIGYLSGNKNSYSIGAHNFLNFYDIKQTGKYIPKLENIPNIGERWVIYLND